MWARRQISRCLNFAWDSSNFSTTIRTKYKGGRDSSLAEPCSAASESRAHRRNCNGGRRRICERIGIKAYLVPALHRRKEGWLRHQENVAQPPRDAAGVVFLWSINRKTTPASLLADASRY